MNFTISLFLTMVFFTFMDSRYFVGGMMMLPRGKSLMAEESSCAPDDDYYTMNKDGKLIKLEPCFFWVNSADKKFRVSIVNVDNEVKGIFKANGERVKLCIGKEIQWVKMEEPNNYPINFVYDTHPTYKPILGEECRSSAVYRKDKGV